MFDVSSGEGALPEVIIGTSGYSYNDWKGIFYPDELPSSRYLEHYCKYFSGLELNYSFYRMPTVNSLKRFLAPKFASIKLSFKAFQGITHTRDDPNHLKNFMERMEVLISKDRLGAVLFQFPYSFRPCQESWDLLSKISAAVVGCVPVVELRHLAWFSSEQLLHLRELNLSVSALDMPDSDELPGIQLPATHQVGYMRFHGRNQSKWWIHENAWERYDYLYSAELIEARIADLKAWMALHKKVYFFFNNHYRGQAVQNAQLLMAFLAD